MNRIIDLKDIKEMYMYLKECSPLFECLNLYEYNSFYMSVEETYNDIMNLLLFQNNNNILVTEKLIHMLYNVLNRSSGKKVVSKLLGLQVVTKQLSLILYVVLY
jgi:hypothetical protein